MDCKVIAIIVNEGVFFASSLLEKRQGIVLLRVVYAIAYLVCRLEF
jgi:hypothetical protein